MGAWQTNTDEPVSQWTSLLWLWYLEWPLGQIIGYAATLAVPVSSCDNTHAVGSHLVDASRGHGSIVEAQEGPDLLQALCPVAPPPQVQGVIAPDHQVRHVGRQARVQGGLVLAQARLSCQEPAGTQTRVTWSSWHKQKKKKTQLKCEIYCERKIKLPHPDSRQLHVFASSSRFNMCFVFPGSDVIKCNYHKQAEQRRRLRQRCSCLISFPTTCWSSGADVEGAETNWAKKMKQLFFCVGLKIKQKDYRASKLTVFRQFFFFFNYQEQQWHPLILNCWCTSRKSSGRTVNGLAELIFAFALIFTVLQMKTKIFDLQNWLNVCQQQNIYLII